MKLPDVVRVFRDVARRSLVAAVTVAFLAAFNPAHAQWFTYESGVPLPAVMIHQFALEPMHSAASERLDLQGDEGTIEFFASAGEGWPAAANALHQLEPVCVVANGRTIQRRESVTWTPDGDDPNYKGELNTFFAARYAVYLDADHVYFQSGITMYRRELPQSLGLDPTTNPVHFALVTAQDGSRADGTPRYTTRIYIDGSEPLVLAGIGYGDVRASRLHVAGLPSNARGAVRLDGKMRTSRKPPFRVEDNLQVYQGGIGGLRIWSQAYPREVFKAVGGAPPIRKYCDYDIQRSIAFPRNGLFSGKRVPRFRDLVAYGDFRFSADQHRIRLPHEAEGNWRNTLQSQPTIAPLYVEGRNSLPPQVFATEAPVYTIRPIADPAIRAGAVELIVFRDGVAVGLISEEGTGRSVFRTSDGASATFRLVDSTSDSSDDRRGDAVAPGEMLVFSDLVGEALTSGLLGPANEGRVVFERPSNRWRGAMVNGKDDPFFLANRVQNVQVAARGYDMRTIDFERFDLAPRQILKPGSADEWEANMTKAILGEPGENDWVLDYSGNVAPLWYFDVPISRSDSSVIVETTTNETELMEEMRLRVGMKSKWPTGAVSANASYKKAMETKDFSTHVRTTVTSGFHKLALVVDRVNLTLSPDFEDAVRALRYSKELGVDCKRLLNEWGTHFVYSMTYGSLAFGTKVIDRKDISRAISRGFDVDVSVKAGLEATEGTPESSAEISAGVGEKTRLWSRNSIATEKSDFRTIGSSGVSIGSGGDATATLDGNFPVSPDMRPIWELLSPIYFDDPEIYVRVRSRLKAAFMDEAHQLAMEGFADGVKRASQMGPAQIEGLEKTYHIKLYRVGAVQDHELFGRISVKPVTYSEERGREDYVAKYLDEGTGAVKAVTHDDKRAWLFKNTEADGVDDSDNTFDLLKWSGEGSWTAFDAAPLWTSWIAESNESYAANHPDLVGPGEAKYSLYRFKDLDGVTDEEGNTADEVDLTIADIDEFGLEIEATLSEWNLGATDVHMIQDSKSWIPDTWFESTSEDEPKYVELAWKGSIIDRSTEEKILGAIFGAPGAGAPGDIIDDSDMEQMTATLHDKIPLTMKTDSWFSLLFEIWQEEAEPWQPLAQSIAAANAENDRVDQIVEASAMPRVAVPVAYYPFGRDIRTPRAGEALRQLDVAPEQVLGNALQVGLDPVLLDAGELDPLGSLTHFDFILGTDAEGLAFENEAGTIRIEARRNGVRFVTTSGNGEPGHSSYIYGKAVTAGEWHKLIFVIDADSCVRWSFDGVLGEAFSREKGGFFGVEPPTDFGEGLLQHRRLLEEGGRELIEWSDRWVCSLIEPVDAAAAANSAVPTRIDEVIFSQGLSGSADLARFRDRQRHVRKSVGLRRVLHVPFATDEAPRQDDPSLTICDLPGRTVVAEVTDASSNSTLEGAFLIRQDVEIDSVPPTGESFALHVDVRPGELDSVLRVGPLALECVNGVLDIIIGYEGLDPVARFSVGAANALDPARWHKLILSVDAHSGQLELIVDNVPLIDAELRGDACAVIEDGVRQGIAIQLIDASFENDDSAETATGESTSAAPDDAATDGDGADGATDENAEESAEENAQAAADEPTIDYPRYDELILFSRALEKSESSRLAARHRVPGGESPPMELIRVPKAEPLTLAQTGLTAADEPLLPALVAYYPLSDGPEDRSGRNGAALAASSDAAPSVELPGLSSDMFTFHADMRIDEVPGVLFSLGGIAFSAEKIVVKLPGGRKRVNPVGCKLALELRSASGMTEKPALTYAGDRKIAVVPSRAGARLPLTYRAVRKGEWHKVIVSVDWRQGLVRVAIDGQLFSKIEISKALGSPSMDAPVLELGAGASATFDEIIVLDAAAVPGSPVWNTLSDRPRQ